MDTTSIILGEDIAKFYKAPILALGDESWPTDDRIMVIEQTPRVQYCSDFKGGWNEYGKFEKLCSIISSVRRPRV